MQGSPLQLRNDLWVFETTTTTKGNILNTTVFVAAVALWWASTSVAVSQFGFDVETGGVFPGYNDVQIPGKGGTLFSLSRDLKTENSIFVRGRAFYTFGVGHTFSVLVAPLTVKATGEIPRAVQFQSDTFAANTLLEARWKFNSYRLTYRYDFVKSEDIELGIGFTGKIRDAEIRLSGGGQVSSKANVGFVPLLNFRFVWNAGTTVGFLVEGDALAAPQGRAEDVLAAITFKPSEDYIVRAGYRILEGGANNDKVYNFALFHYLVFGVTVTL